MKNRRNMMVYVLLILVLAGIGAGTTVLSGQSVQKSMEEAPTNPAWDKVMAMSVNRQEIHLEVDGRAVDLQGLKLYMSEDLELMIPSDIVIDTFDCAQNLYQGKELVIEKGGSKATVKVGSDWLKFNDNEYQLPETVNRKDDSIYLPVSLFESYLGYDYTWNSETNTAILNNASQADSFLPEKYSYIEEKRSVAPKDQGQYGTCWAFATLTALETALMPEEEIDFSEDHLVHQNELSEGISDGGDYIMSMAYLMAWKGPVLEKDDPYGDNQSDAGLKPVKHVQGAEILPKKDYQQIKEMVYKYGGVESSMYMSLENSNSESVYYNSAESAYCYLGKNKPNHDVVIIGWDDNYPKERFQNDKIKSDGAFICLNSWGGDFGQQGVFHVSYEDAQIGRNNVCYTDIEDVDNYDRVYQSDLCGWTGTMGFEKKSSAYFANVYTAKKSEHLQAVGFYAATDDLHYDVFVCENYTGKNSLNERNHISASGDLRHKGYYTIVLDKDYVLKKNKKFAVIVKVSGREEDRVYKIIPVEMDAQGLEGKVDLSDGEGYFSAGGYNWQSAEKQKCNICLKAYTSKASK